MRKRDNVADRLRKKLLQKQGGNKLCLTMIVRNESKNMPRILNSLKNIIDFICITDTGSLDNTIEIIETWGKDNNIPTTVLQEPFKNFAYNRTFSVVKAKLAYPQATYFLLSDADFVWEDHGFDKNSLTHHIYQVKQYNRLLDYWNTRILSSKIDWECIGVTHEFWKDKNQQNTYLGEIKSEQLETLMINDLEDGGHKDDKFQRDEKLLRDALADPKTPKNLKTRYYFYLAQTLKDTKRYQESILIYQQRIDCGGWPEEIYYSFFQIGFNHEQLGWNLRQEYLNWKKSFLDSAKDTEYRENIKNYFDQAEIYYLKAHKYRTIRAESLYYLVRMLRNLGILERAADLCFQGMKIKYPKDSLFVQRDCYIFYFYEELYIISSLLNHQENKLFASEKLRTLGKDLPVI